MSGLTRLNWNEVFSLPAIEFLTYIQFNNYKVRREEQRLNDFKRRTKNG